MTETQKSRLERIMSLVLDAEPGKKMQEDDILWMASVIEQLQGQIEKLRIQNMDLRIELDALRKAP